MITIIVGFVVIAVICISIFAVKNKKDSENLFPSKDVETLSLAEVITFFKKDEISAKLKENQNSIAVVKKEKNNDFIKIIACIFNKETNSVIDTKFGFAWNTKNLTDDLSEMFSDKDMIILQ